MTLVSGSLGHVDMSQNRIERGVFGSQDYGGNTAKHVDHATVTQKIPFDHGFCSRRSVGVSPAFGKLLGKCFDGVPGCVCANSLGTSELLSAAFGFVRICSGVWICSWNLTSQSDRT